MEDEEQISILTNFIPFIECFCVWSTNLLITVSSSEPRWTVTGAVNIVTVSVDATVTTTESINVTAVSVDATVTIKESIDVAAVSIDTYVTITESSNVTAVSVDAIVKSQIQSILKPYPLTQL